MFVCGVRIPRRSNSWNSAGFSAPIATLAGATRIAGWQIYSRLDAGQGECARFSTHSRDVGAQNYRGEFTDSYANFSAAFMQRKIRGTIAVSARRSLVRKWSTTRCNSGAKKTRLRAAE